MDEDLEMSEEDILEEGDEEEYDEPDTLRDDIESDLYETWHE